MLSHTRRALEDFDNQHDFERLAADVLNALGYENVEPMAPSGGPDGGRDIKFTEGDESGTAFVTLDRSIEKKFKADLAKTPPKGVIALFCSVTVSPSKKRTMTETALAEGCRLEFFDLERLRSLLDSSLKGVRRRYLGIDDEIASRIRSDVSRLLRYPSAVADEDVPPTMIETLLVDTLPRRLFDALVRYDEVDVNETPDIGDALRRHVSRYYSFREKALRLEAEMMDRIGDLAISRLLPAWRIYLKYAELRFCGMSQEGIERGPSFLNWGITWDEAERVYSILASDAALSSGFSALIQDQAGLIDEVGILAKRVEDLESAG
jgi:hypothetical protein